MIEKVKPSKEIIDLIKSFPTNTERTLDNKSYFHYVYSLLHKSNRFLEIGYRKGLFLEVAKLLDVPSVHIDISDDLLRAEPTETNIALTTSSVDYLKECSDHFDFIFQDGSKELSVRKEEYDLIVNGNILDAGGVILCDDLHYGSCMKAFDYAKKIYGFESSIFRVKDKTYYTMGVLWK